jgi:RNA-directed DNA polymerase
MLNIQRLQETWRDALTARIRRVSTVKAALGYVDRVSERGFPPIFDFGHLATLFGVREGVLAQMAFSTRSYYRTFSIPKRKGGFREIATPYPILLQAQRWILENILELLHVHDCAHGFIKRRSILSFAKPHLNKRALLHADIQNFFPSIRLNRIYGVFSEVGFPPNVSYILSRLCCLQGVLPQGAVTSPYLSNIVATSLDRRLSGLAKEHDLSYTRYADNLVLSGDRVPPYMLDTVQGILLDEGFLLNADKSFLSTGRGRRVIAGISVVGTLPRLPRQTKRVWRQEAHYLITEGYWSHTERRAIFDPVYIERCMGRLEFWSYVEPDNKFPKQALERLRGDQSGIGARAP